VTSSLAVNRQPVYGDRNATGQCGALNNDRELLTENVTSNSLGPQNRDDFGDEPQIIKNV